MKLTLCYAPMTCALVPYVTLTEAGAEFEVQNVNTRSGQNRTPEFLALNPKHKVPVLVIDGEPLTENVAIQISFKLDVSGFRNCVAHFDRMQQRPSVRKVLAYGKQVQDAFARAA